MKWCLILLVAFLAAGCSFENPPSDQTVETGPAPTKKAEKSHASHVPEPERGAYVTSFSSTGRWIYCVKDPELPLRLTGTDDWEYYPTVEAAQERRPGYRLYRPCDIRWPEPKSVK